MFCPNCGGQNQDDLVVYCRECGENLQVVSQAMKGHLSVALVTRIDAVIEKRNERLRRDAILGALRLGRDLAWRRLLGAFGRHEQACHATAVPSSSTSWPVARARP